MLSTEELVAKFEVILREVLERTKASRTTLRLDIPERNLHVDRVAAEALTPGTRSIKEETSLDQRNAVAVKWLEKNRRIFVENDALNADPEVAPEREVVEIYGICAEMVGPLIRNGELVGWMSVHFTGGPRNWAQEDIAALQHGLDSVSRLLDRAG